ncbi:flagellar export chaperone FlgN [Fuchsiella alkaliacetigena]|uniref:flagellar export chaperone FlgN n=1 Tax=Fuchsiella alkaliacetigena TaxID=957042 RepID=UPI00200A7C2D|nr:flagellar export chaperone FlgN [Fuchsiella alkaliacetigena]MCK8824186.1 flagellar protein FlgN [Fuchsiella alkaliacetigena]
MKAKQIVTSLTKIYSSYLELCQQVLALTLQQQKILAEIEIEDSEIDYLGQLEELLQEKGTVIEKLAELEKKVLVHREDIIKKQNLTEENWLLELLESELSTEELKDIVAKLVKVSRKLEATDEKNQELIQSKSNQITEEIKQIKQGVKINKSYNSRLRIHSTYIDDKS